MKILSSFIILTLFLGLNCFSQTTAESFDKNPFAKNLDVFLREQSAKGFSGAVLVVKNRKIVFDQTYGSAAKMNSAPTFWIASKSKSFVAAAILKLAEQGKLSTADALTKFFKDVPADKRQITVHHLLTHTSGLPHKYAADGETDRERAARKIFAVPLGWKIGEGFHYSNDGYTLLAAIVEIASQKSFEDYLRAEILAPAKLKETGFWGFEDKKTSVAPLANPKNAGTMSTNFYQNGRSVANWGYRGATGMFSTTRDLYQWMQAINENKVLSGATREKLWEKHVLMSRISESEEQFYGYGWMTRHKNGKRVYVRHTGFEDWLGHSGAMCLYDNGDAYVVLSNSGGYEKTSWGAFISGEIDNRLQN